jgi:transcriptional regulator with XRE-family HTH domain
MNIVGRKIKSIRLSKGMSATFLASKLKIHISTLNKYESGTRKVNVDLLPNLAEVLGVTIGYFFEEKLDETSTEDVNHVQQ